jgi:hypothetical protein
VDHFMYSHVQTNERAQDPYFRLLQNDSKAKWKYLNVR